jgi:hypothetical protein
MPLRHYIDFLLSLQTQQITQMKKLLYILLFLPLFSNATTYYVSPTGSDGAAGTSPGTAWQTISKVNGSTFSPGDIIRFQSGQTFSGSLSFTASSWTGATSSNPILVNHYGVGGFTISSGSSNGISVENNSGLIIRGVTCTGSGIAANTATGLNVDNSQTGNTKLDYVFIDSVTVSGYGGNGISISSSKGTSGFNHVTIQNCITHDCTGGIANGGGSAGIMVFSTNDGYGSGSTTPCFTNVLIQYCTSYNNTGKAVDVNWVGSGIFMGQTGSGTIQYCTAYNNGANSTNSGGGPVGIWHADCINCIIQYCESYSNKTGNFGSDGGGFDIDGGSVNSIVQYNYSHDNAGSGYQIYTYNDGIVTALDSAIVRYNISQNDASNGSSIQANCMIGNDGGSITRVYVYNNTFYQTSTTNPNLCFESNVSGLTGRLANNILYSNGNQLIRSNNNNPTGFGVTGNDYYPTGSFSLEWANTTYTSFSTWQTATGLEKIAGSNVGKQLNPVLMSPGNGGTINAINSALVQYRLSNTSGVIGQGLNLLTLFGLTVGSTDFYGNTIPNTSGTYDIGAAQYNVLKFLGRIVLH